MTRPILAVLLLAVLCGAGCGTQGIILGTQSSYLFVASDALASPGQPTELRASLQGGDFLAPRRGHTVLFFRDGKLIRAAQTDSMGIARAEFTPSEVGNITLQAMPAPNELSDAPPEPAELLVASRKPDEPIVVVDLDKTVVASGFHKVMVGQAEAMDRSPEVLSRIAHGRTVVYLTHRPDYFGPKSKAFLKRNGFPTGPLLLSTISGFLKGSGTFKTEVLRDLRSRFKNVDMGIGDKFSDAESYHKVGMQSFLIFHYPDTDDPEDYREAMAKLEALPDDIHVVTTWTQIEGILYRNETVSREPIVDRLAKLVAEKEALQKQREQTRLED